MEVPQRGMFYWPAELLWIGCLTGSIWTPRSKSVTWTPNTNSKTYWQNEISHVMSGTIFFIRAISAISAPLAALRISAYLPAPKWRRGYKNKKEERVVSKSRPAAMNLSSPIATSSSSASSSIACESLEMPIASGKPDSRMGNSNAFDAVSTSQVRLQDAYIGGSMGKQRWNPSQQEEEDSEDSDNPEIWYYNKFRREPLPKTVKLGGSPLHTEPVLQLIRKVQKDTEATWRHYFQISPHIPVHGSRLVHDQENLWKTTWRPCERLGCELGYLGTIQECHSSSSSLSWTRLWCEFLICEENSLENCGTAFQRNRKAGQRSDRNLWHKHDCFPRFDVDVDRLIAQSSLSIFHCQSLRLLRFCILFGKDVRRPYWILEEQNSMEFGQQLFQGIESDWWTTYGIRVEDFPRTHFNGNPQTDSTDDERITV